MLKEKKNIFDNRLISEKELLRIVSISKSTIRRWEISGDFPRRISLGKRRVVWRYSDVVSWIELRESQSGLVR